MLVSSPKKILFSAALLVAIIGGASLASKSGLVEPAQAAQPAKSRIEKAINESLGASGVVVQSVEKVKFFDDVYEVVVDHNNSKKIVYSNASGSHIIFGDLMDSKTMQNLTQAQLEQLNAINFASDLKPELALKTTYGTGIRKIAVFEDPNCGYCKRFRRDAIATLKDTTVYTYVYPVLGQDSRNKAETVLCSDDSVKMWDGWMLANQPPKGEGNCGAPLEELVKLGRG
ncbi:MAG: DsbC family protein, partial [Limnobacter sp.]|nr:DsbC family protein [Limnobacter sp.]